MTSKYEKDPKTYLLFRFSYVKNVFISSSGFIPQTYAVKYFYFIFFSFIHKPFSFKVKKEEARVLKML